MTSSFNALDLRPELVQAVVDQGYDAPTPIQSALIPVLLAGHDAVGQAGTGTGKTAAFALPLLQRMEAGGGAPQALVLVPTRELATQVASAVFNYGKHLGVRVLPVFGGQPYEKQIRRLRQGVDVVVGTPGRLLDLLARRDLDLSAVTTLVLDEADEMLSMGFIEDIEALLAATPAERQTALLSATMPPAIRRLADQYLRDPRTCTVERQAGTASAIEQRAYLVHHRDKLAALIRLLETEDVQSALVFAQTRAGTAEVAAALTERGYPAEAMSGELSQDARQAVLGRLRAGRLRLLVATDVAARGIDVEGLSHVVNFDMPWDAESYVHRIGRTGRAGRSGVALSLVTTRERGLVRRIEHLTGQPLPVVELPSVEAVLEQREAELAAKLTKQLDEAPSDRTMRILTNLVADGHDPMDIAAAALALAGGAEEPVEHIREVRDSGGHHAGGRPARFDRGDRTHGDRPQGGRRFEKRGDRPSGGAPRSHEDGMVRLTLDVGHRDRVLPGQIVSAIARVANVPGKAIGRIDIQQGETWVDVPEAHVAQVLAQSGRYQIGRTKASVEKA